MVHPLQVGRLSTDYPPDVTSRSRRTSVELVVASALMLFVELVLIRWTGAEVTYLSYFSNFVLLGSFLGIGLGFLGARQHPNLFRWAPVPLTFFVAFVMAFPVTLDRRDSSFIFFGSLEQHGLPIWVMLPVIFLAVAAVMATIANGVATRFSRFEPLDAYRLDIIGSLIGIVTYSTLAFLHTPPLVWALIITGMFIFLLDDLRWMVQWVAIAGLLVTFGFQSFQGNTIWSPYYRITLSSALGGSATYIDVNGIPHQAILSSAVRTRIHADYAFPYRHAPSNSLDNVLVIGAGTGNDVAVALEQGAHHVDAVEIDPALLQVGIDRHPDRPYQDRRVNRIVGDGRAFLENTNSRYDLIVFALPDSLTLVTGQSGVRLESYLFTREAFETARQHLAPGGVLSVYNYYRATWLVDRLAGTLADVFGSPPCVYTGEQGADFGAFTFMLDAVSPDSLECDARWSADGRVVVAPATDDRPFIYLRGRAIPAQYVWTLLLILLASVVAVRLAGARARAMSPYLDLFLMGAAFLLLETKSVVQFALLFGTTWFVNALVFAGILLSVLVAIEVERRSHIERRRLLFSLLFAGLTLAAIVPMSSLLSLTPVVRFLVATAIAFFPVFVANLIFAGRFREARDSTAAFGANLLGAMFGGTLEYVALATGYRMLLLFVAVLYALSWYFMHRPVRTQAPIEPSRVKVPANA
jgi:spermidine synthase